MIIRALPPLAALLLLALAPFSSPRDVSAEEAPAYIALGDSLAFGVGAANPAAEGYVALTAARLSDHALFTDSGLQLINLSEPGATSADLAGPGGQLDQAIEEIETRQTDAESNDAVEIISIDIGGNDLLALAEPDSPCFDDAAGGPCRKALNAMLGALQENLTRALSKLRQAAPTSDIYVIDLYNPYSGAGEPIGIISDVGVQQVNGVIAAVSAAEELDVRFVSVYELFQASGAAWVAPDGIHPNNDGHRVLSEALMAAIEGRSIALPTDLAQPPALAPVDSGSSGSGDDVSLTLLLVLVPAAFAAGGFVSAAYFLMLGRG